MRRQDPIIKVFPEAVTFDLESTGWFAVTWVQGVGQGKGRPDEGAPSSRGHPVLEEVDA